MTDEPTRSELEYSLQWCRSKIDEQAAEIERLRKQLEARPRCQKCNGTGTEYRGGDRGYIDCFACNGRGY